MSKRSAPNPAKGRALTVAARVFEKRSIQTRFVNSISFAPKARGEALSIRITFWRALWPLITLTADAGTSSRSAMNSISSRLARPFSGAAASPITGPVAEIRNSPRFALAGRALTSTVR